MQNAELVCMHGLQIMSVVVNWNSIIYLSMVGWAAWVEYMEVGLQRSLVPMQTELHGNETTASARPFQGNSLFRCVIIDLMMDESVSSSVRFRSAVPQLEEFALAERLGSGTYATVYKAFKKVGSVINCLYQQGHEII